MDLFWSVRGIGKKQLANGAQALAIEVHDAMVVMIRSDEMKLQQSSSQRLRVRIVS
jgi:hypothetical protein